jgi:8-oxo-dGTP pyrophosphatase MutT (NUDIX family)
MSLINLSAVRTSDLVRDGNGWKTISSHRHFGDEHLEVATEVVQTPNRPKPKPWTIVHRKPAVVIAAMRADGKFLLVRQERIPIRSAIWETPAGQIDQSTEPDKHEVRTAALRELLEETGYELTADGDLIPLGHYFSSPGFTDEHAYFFLARPVTPRAGSSAGGEAELILDCQAFALDDLRQMIAQNEIRDANTLSVFAKLDARGLLRVNPRD